MIGVNWYSYGQSSWKSKLSINKSNWAKDASFIFYLALQVIAILSSDLKIQ